MREASSETYGPRVYFPYYIFRSIYFAFRFSILFHLSLLDLILASNHEGIDNPFIALGASVLLFVQVHRLGLACTSYWINTLVLNN